MPERMDLHGKDAPPYTITHNGKTYSIPHALDVGDLLSIEKSFYQRAVDTLAVQKDAMDKDDYRNELEILRNQYEDGEFSFEHEGTQALLLTRAGTMLFLSHVLKAPEAEVFNLLAEKGAELISIMSSVTKATFPDAKPEPKVEGTGDPKAKARRKKRDRKERRRAR